MLLQRRICFDFFNFIELKGIQCEDPALCKCFPIQTKINYMMFSLLFSRINSKYLNFNCIYSNRTASLNPREHVPFLPAGHWIFSTLTPELILTLTNFQSVPATENLSLSFCYCSILLLKPEEQQRKYPRAPEICIPLTPL